MTALAQIRPVESITDPSHVHTRTCYWDCREARWQCPQESTSTTSTGAMSDVEVVLQP